MQTSTSKNSSLPSVCPLDCPDTCSLTVAVENNQVISVRGSHSNPFTAGSVCAKVSKSYPDFVHGERRLKWPLKRSGNKGYGEFERVSWDAALELVHTNVMKAVDQFGAESVVPYNYSGPHGKLSGGSMDLRFFHKLGASQLNRGTLCAGVQNLALTSMYGDVPGMPPEDAEFSNLIVIWGLNVTVSNLHLQRVLQKARQRGAKLIVVDPRRIKVAEQADLHVQINPGTDVLLAQGIAAELQRMNAIDMEFANQWISGLQQFMQSAKQHSLDWIADQCGIDKALITEFAKLYAESNPASMFIGVAVERNRNGGNGVRAAAALPALANKFGVRGGGLSFGISSAYPSDGDALQRPDFMPAPCRTLNILDIPRHILEQDISPPVAALFIYNHNPLAVHPEQNRMREALASDKVFTIGCDVVMTDSLQYADVILPACSHFEHADVYAAYGQHYLQRADAVIPPVEEALPNTEIFRRLAQTFGFTETAFKDTDKMLMDSAFDLSDQSLNNTRPSELIPGQVLPVTIDGRPKALFEKIVPATPSGKIELFSEDLEQCYGAGVPNFKALNNDFPLVLISPSSDKRTNATFGGSPQSKGHEIMEMNPADAKQRDLSAGHAIRVWNNLGEVNLKLKLTENMKPGLVSVAKGAWLHTSETGQTINSLIPGHRTDIGDGACYNDTMVEVESLHGP
ncbi:MAG: anaerobic selenocysteine-containing dehydrogenase [Parasphingorhabdus sp.]|jgi:anaerobic selenocysteine-containing dehydrogenase